jgi:hypothetical protein
MACVVFAYSTGYRFSGIVLWLTFQVEIALHHMVRHAMLLVTCTVRGLVQCYYSILPMVGLTHHLVY